MTTRRTGKGTLAGYETPEALEEDIQLLKADYYDNYAFLNDQELLPEDRPEYGKVYPDTKKPDATGRKTGTAGYAADGSGTPCYNGNISSICWKAGEEQTPRGYRFAYDGLDRMKTAEYGEGERLAENPNRFNEEVTAYDKMENILEIKRTGQAGAKEYGLIDNLSLTYHGNRLTKVTDNAAETAYDGGFEFRDGADEETEYTYDENGNLTQNLNRNIRDIQYNFLNLPLRIEFGDGSTTEFLYDAQGRKLRTVHREDGKTTTTDYAGNLICENGKPLRLVTGYGYVSLPDGMYHYYLQDHLGNNRVVADRNGKVEEVNLYYPFGGIFANSGNVQPYKYNGKELDTHKGLNWYDYRARYYDATLGRWHVQDPMAEKYYNTSQYAYTANNPINCVDSNGKEWKYITDNNGHITINVALNFSISGNYTEAQINAYKNAISSQFHNTIYESSGGAMSGTITFYEGNPNIIQSLSLSKADGAIGGTTSYFNSSVNLFNRAGELKSLSNIGSDAIHEILHTVRLAHPFEQTQTEDTKLVRVAPNTFCSTPTTDTNIINNVMNYPMITIDGQKSTIQNSLTKGQLNFILKEINLQNKGYGFFKYNPALTPEKNYNLYKQYYENYWNNTPGIPVSDK